MAATATVHNANLEIWLEKCMPENEFSLKCWWPMAVTLGSSILIVHVTVSLCDQLFIGWLVVFIYVMVKQNK